MDKLGEMVVKPLKTPTFRLRKICGTVRVFVWKKLWNNCGIVCTTKNHKKEKTYKYTKILQDLYNKGELST